jgi:hypothetical protein
VSKTHRKSLLAYLLAFPMVRLRHTLLDFPESMIREPSFE